MSSISNSSSCCCFIRSNLSMLSLNIMRSSSEWRGFRRREIRWNCFCRCRAEFFRTSPILPIMLNGKTSLSQEHVALTNQDVVNHLVRRERAKEFAWGMDFQGVQYLMFRQNDSNPYIRHVELFPDGRFIILCQSSEQSRLLMHSTELHADKTFSRTKCRKFEIKLRSR